MRPKFDSCHSFLKRVHTLFLKFPIFVRKTHLTVENLSTKIQRNPLLSPQNRCINWVKIRINEIFRATFCVIHSNCQIWDEKFMLHNCKQALKWNQTHLKETLDKEVEILFFIDYSLLIYIL